MVCKTNFFWTAWVHTFPEKNSWKLKKIVTSSRQTKKSSYIKCSNMVTNQIRYLSILKISRETQQYQVNIKEFQSQKSMKFKDCSKTEGSPSRFAELPILPNFSISQLHIANFEFWLLLVLYINYTFTFVVFEIS